MEVASNTCSVLFGDKVTGGVLKKATETKDEICCGISGPGCGGVKGIRLHMKKRMMLLAAVSTVARPHFL